MVRGLRKAFNNASAIVLAVAVHIIVLGVLVVNMEWSDVKPAAKPKASPIQTQTVDRQLIEKELARIKKEKQEKAAKEKRRLADLEKQRIAKEKARQEKIKQQKLQAKRKKEADIKRKKKLALEKKKAAEKKAAAKKAAEKRKKELADAAKKKRIADEQKRLDSLEKQRQQKRMEEELARAVEDEENQSQIARIIALIQADVQNNWRIPPTVKKGMQCRMLIRLLPSGEVQTVRITKTSGDAVFDKAAEDAVYRASPLPVSVSSAGKLFEKFRELDFLFNPK